MTSFTAAEVLGLTRWRRDDPHVLVPGGTKIRRVPQLSTRVHFASDWSKVASGRLGVHEPGAALVLAAGSFRSVRPACGILAAGVQQRVVTADDLTSALIAAPRVRHRAELVLAVQDIGQGSEALSEIDFIRLCRRHGLPEPVRQAVRREPSGRRRYVDAEWVRRDGRRVVAEVDGALHLIVMDWCLVRFKAALGACATGQMRSQCEHCCRARSAICCIFGGVPVGTEGGVVHGLTAHCVIEMVLGYWCSAAGSRAPR